MGSLLMSEPGWSMTSPDTGHWIVYTPLLGISNSTFSNCQESLHCFDNSNWPVLDGVKYLPSLVCIVMSRPFFVITQRVSIWESLSDLLNFTSPVEGRCPILERKSIDDLILTIFPRPSPSMIQHLKVQWMMAIKPELKVISKGKKGEGVENDTDSHHCMLAISTIPDWVPGVCAHTESGLHSGLTQAGRSHVQSCDCELYRPQS